MAKVNSLLTKRLKSATERLSKMTSLASRSSSGELSSFSGVFHVTPLNEHEIEKLKSILFEYSEKDDVEVEEDLKILQGVTSEVKAINTQAAILHGERIKRAQDILKQYRDGAFSAWLLATYGNRQTPYNFLQYFELFQAMPKDLHAKLEEMPRLALYVLASRSGSMKQKEKIVKNYKGETKAELLTIIRDTFPIPKSDGRSHDIADSVITQLKKLHRAFQEPHFEPSEKQKTILRALINSLDPLTK